MSKTLADWSKEIYEWAERKGWNKDIDLRGELMNFHSEISEAWEEWRKDPEITRIYFVDVNGKHWRPGTWEEALSYAKSGMKPEGIFIEIADLMIRILHSVAYHKLEIERAMQVKMAYNETREYRHGGKIA